MTLPLLSRLALAFLIVSGWASQYDPGVAERVIAVRQTRRVAGTLPETLPPVDGFIAVEDCRHIGETWFLRPEGTDKWSAFLVIDCSGHTETSRWMREGNILVEVDHQTAVRWNTVGRGIRIERVCVPQRWRRQWLESTAGEW